MIMGTKITKGADRYQPVAYPPFYRGEPIHSGYGSALLGRSGTRLMGIIRPIYNGIYNEKRYRRIFLTIDDEGLFVIPIVHAVGEIARGLGPITFQ